MIVKGDDSIKKITPIVAVVIVIVILILGIYNIFFKPVKSTDLSIVQIDGKSLTELLENDEEKTFEVYIDSEKRKKVELIGVGEVTTIKQIKQNVGKNYKDRIYNYEQKLRKMSYFDKQKNIKLTFVYQSNLNKSLVWVELEQYK